DEHVVERSRPDASRLQMHGAVENRGDIDDARPGEEGEQDGVEAVPPAHQGPENPARGGAAPGLGALRHRSSLQRKCERRAPGLELSDPALEKNTPTRAAR